MGDEIVIRCLRVSRLWRRCPLKVLGPARTFDSPWLFNCNFAFLFTFVRFASFFLFVNYDINCVHISLLPLSLYTNARFDFLFCFYFDEVASSRSFSQVSIILLLHCLLWRSTRPRSRSLLQQFACSVCALDKNGLGDWFFFVLYVRDVFS